MKLTFNFQTLILLTMTVILAVATAIWGAAVYQVIYDIILRGFDRKLEALSAGAAEFTDGDGHAQFQRPYKVGAMCAGADGQLYGLDTERGILLRINPEDGGAIEERRLADSAWRSIACDSEQPRVWLLASDGKLINEWTLSGEQTAPELRAMSEEADQLIYLDGTLWARRGQTLLAVDADLPALTLEQEVATLAPAPAPARFAGLAVAEQALMLFDAEGKLLQRQPLNPAGYDLNALAWLDGTLYAAAESLLTVNPVSGILAENFAPGYYSEQHPFFQRYVSAYQNTRVAAGLTFLYTEVHLGADQIRYILDGSVGDDHSPPGYLDVVPEDSVADVTLAQSRGQAFVSDIREWEEWGLIKVSAEPIYGSSGKIVALAGADVDIGVIRDKTRFALFAVLFVGAGLLLLAGSVSYRVSQSLMRPLRNIKDSALRIAAGYHDTHVDYPAGDEIGQLAQGLNELSSRLAAQARQSETYQRALTRGRELIALEHALIDIGNESGADLGLEVECTREPVESGRVGVGNAALLWLVDDSAGDNLELRHQRVLTQEKSRVLLANHPAERALDLLFMNSPRLLRAACWEPARRSLAIRCHAPFRLRLLEADGGERWLDCNDSMSLLLAPGQRLYWHEYCVIGGTVAAAGALA